MWFDRVAPPPTIVLRCVVIYVIAIYYSKLVAIMKTATYVKAEILNNCNWSDWWFINSARLWFHWNSVKVLCGIFMILWFLITAIFIIMNMIIKITLFNTAFRFFKDWQSPCSTSIQCIFWNPLVIWSLSQTVL